MFSLTICGACRALSGDDKSQQSYGNNPVWL